MIRYAPALFLLATACGPARQPDSMKTTAAFEVPLHNADDRQRFLALLNEVSEANGYHVDAATPSELEWSSQVSPITFNAAVWRGNDEELMASAMDFQDRIGRVWISFPKGEAPLRSMRFQKALMARVRQGWPETASLPIMPSGAIPLTEDLVRTDAGYSVKPGAAGKYRDGE